VRAIIAGVSTAAITETVPSGPRSAQREIIDAIASSQTFEHAPVSRALLLYLFQHAGITLNEYMIGTEALGRRQDFDPRTDAAVRVQLSRLRNKLAEYNAHEGKNAQVEVVLPRGGYVLEFVDHKPQSPEPVAAIPAEALAPLPTDAQTHRVPDISKPTWTREHLLRVAALLVVCVITTFFVARWTTAKPSQTDVHKPVVSFTESSFWSTLVGNDMPVRILVPNPTFFKWGDAKSGESIHARSVNVNSFADMAQSPMLSQLARKLGPPVLSQEYMSVYDARSTLLLLSFLNDHAINAQFSFASEYPTDEMDKENVVLLGTGTTLRRFDEILKSTSLRFDPLTTAITRVDEKSHVIQRFDPINESGDVSYIPQMLACLPTGVAGKKALVIAGFRNQALLHYITSDAGQNEIGKRQKLGNSPFFEAVVLAEMNGNTPLRSSIAYFRSLPAPSAPQDTDLHR
jgi:hypothetical protein